MVGVPGRSKACQQCKKRRVACDLQQPECTRCVRAKRQCEYTQGRIFVQHQEGGHRSMYKKEDGALANQECDGVHGTTTSQQGRASSEDSESSGGIDCRTVSLLKLPKSNQLCREAFMSSAVEFHPRRQSGRIHEMAGVILSDFREPCMRSSFLACYSSWIGHRDQNPRLIDASREFYVEALKDTHRALAAPDTALADSTVFACSTLGIYEALECPGGTYNAYYWHRAACCRLIRLRGPEAHKDGAAHDFFANFRFFGILDAFDTGQDTFLARPEWVEVPFSIHPKRKFDELLDILALGPKASRLGRSIEKLSKEQQLPTALKIIERLVLIQQRLQIFYTQLESEGPTPVYWERILPVGPDLVASKTDDPDFMFAPVLWFHDMDTAAIMTLFWGMQTMICGGLWDLHGMFQEHGIGYLFDVATSEIGNLTPVMLEFLVLDNARKVLQSMSYCMADAVLDFGPPKAVTQLNIVKEVIRHKKFCEAEYRWADKALKRLGEGYVGILKYDR